MRTERFVAVVIQRPHMRRVDVPWGPPESETQRLKSHRERGVPIADDPFAEVFVVQEG